MIQGVLGLASLLLNLGSLLYHGISPMGRHYSGAAGVSYRAHDAQRTWSSSTTGNRSLSTWTSGSSSCRTNQTWQFLQGPVNVTIHLHVHLQVQVHIHVHIHIHIHMHACMPACQYCHCITLHYSTVHYSTVQYNTVH